MTCIQYMFLPSYFYMSFTESTRIHMILRVGLLIVSETGLRRLFSA